MFIDVKHHVDRPRAGSCSFPVQSR
jgi:hypothetical protein